MARFYIDQELQLQTEIALPIEMIRHIHVLRLRLGDEIQLFNGDGVEYVATIIELEKRKATVSLISSCAPQIESPLHLTLAMCLIANDKMDLTIQKATELGVNLIIPIISERSQRLDKDRIETRIQHWQKIIINSCEQSGRNILPVVKSPIRFNDFLLQKCNNDCKIILSPHVRHQTRLPDVSMNTIVLIGSEGGFTENEVSNAQAHGYVSLLMGNRVLRAETATISALTLCQIRYGDFSKFMEF